MMAQHILVAGLLMLSMLQQPAGRNVIEGQVIRSDTASPQAVANARVILASTAVRLTPTGPSYNEITATVTTDAGRFRLEGVAPGQYLVIASSPGYVTGQYGQRNFDRPGAPLTVVDGTPIAPVQIKLAPTAVIAGTVRDFDNEPMVGANVYLSKVAYTQDGNRTFAAATSTVTDDRGVYRLYWITPGEYVVSANVAAPISGGRIAPRNPSLTPPKSGYSPIYYPGVTDPSRSQTVKVKPGETLEGMALQFVSIPTRSLSGTVTHSQGGRPVRALVQLLPQTAGAVARETPADTNGKYAFSGLPAGRYDVVALTPAAEPEFGTDSVDLQDGDVAGFNLSIKPGNTLRGRVELEGAATLPNLGRTLMMLVEAPGSRGVEMSSPTVVASDGTFQINGVGNATLLEVRVNGLPPEYYVKSARLGGLEAWTAPISVTGPIADTLQIVLSAGAGSVLGTAVDMTGAPFNSATVALIPEARLRGKPAYYKTATTDPSGSFTLRGIAPGEYLLFAWDSVDTNAYYNADFLRQQEPNGTSVTIEPGKETIARLRVIERN